MKTDIITISNDGSHMEEALSQAEKVALYKTLPAKEALNLRLLAEEMLGMMRSITGTRTGQFWIEDRNCTFELHLQVETPMNFDKKEQLLAASKSGKNEAARGFMGRIRSFFDPIDWENTPFASNMEGMSPVFSWTMSTYRKEVAQGVDADQEGAAQAWDELEKSVVSHLADDVKVSIDGRNVEMVILKKSPALEASA